MGEGSRFSITIFVSVCWDELHHLSVLAKRLNPVL